VRGERLEWLAGLALFLAILAILIFTNPTRAACHRIDITANTPSGIGGCPHWGRGDASQYTEAGWGAAMNFCTWTYRHSHGCGSVRVTYHGASVTVPVVDFCDCYQRPGPNGEKLRIIDLQGDVVKALGLPWWNVTPVTVWPAERVQTAQSAQLPDTAMR